MLNIISQVSLLYEETSDIEGIIYICCLLLNMTNTLWKVSKYGVFSGPYSDTFQAV